MSESDRNVKTAPSIPDAQPASTTTAPGAIQPRETPRLNPALLVFALIPLLALSVALGIGTSHNPASGADSLTPPAVEYVPTGFVDKPAPDFTVKMADGSTVSLRSLRGQLVFLNFWATWCAPCQVEMPVYQKLVIHQIPGKATVLSVDADPLEDSSTILSFEKSIHVTIPAATDSDSSVSSAYEVIEKPRTFVIDPQGIVRYDQLGPLTDLELRAYIAKYAPGGADALF